MKLLPDYLAGDERRARLFVKEARAASALNHPNIITVYEIGQWEGRYYIAMEHVEGETLGAHLHRGRASLPKLLGYLQQVAEGLTKAHAAGIVHRDLKPDNIMVTRDGYAKVLDFGLAKLTGSRMADLGLRSEEAETLMQSPPDSPQSAIHHPPPTMPGMVLGTAGYMSPEQAQGLVQEIDHRSDIFSFGCILYEAATGRKAFEGADVLESLHKIVHAPVSFGQMKLVRLTTSGRATDAVISPDGKLVYGSNASGNRDIWLLDPGRGTRKQLTKEARQNFYPRVTPDGSSVLFFFDRGEAFGLWRMDLDGANPRQLIAANMLRFDCSPDGQWIVY